MAKNEEKKSVIVEEPLKMLWLLHAGPPIPSTLDAKHREPLLAKLRDNFLTSVTSQSPLAGSSLLEGVIDDDPHVGSFRTAKLIEPVLVFPCSDGIVVVGGLQAGQCPDHGHPLVSTSLTSLPSERMPEELREPWGHLKNLKITTAQFLETQQHMSVVLHGFYLQVLGHGHESVLS